MEKASVPRFVVLIWAGLGVWFAGRLVDARWHATHSEFEGASQQLEAHWLAWLGVAITLVVAAYGARRLPALRSNSGLQMLVAAGLLYVAVGVWHFIAHAQGSDPAVAHVVLVGANAGMFIGAIVLTVSLRGEGWPDRRRSARGGAAPLSR